jgi:hypothetical protein
LDWASAKLYCEKKGMNLATFDSFEEAQYFNSIAGKDVWVGITDAVEEDKFVQVTGAPTPNLPWNYGEPNNYNENEHCVESGYDGGFNDFDCSMKFRFACERFIPLDGKNDKHEFF